ncbi:RHO1 GDP-GTP exchange protein 2 [Chytridiales sp. JEL 0842]|nr:RHO1 GDP-GTP exchange protein 2 [Chytridiales sp. JEL 0842]
MTVATIYPGCLSEIASAFRRLVPKGAHTKDSIEYANCFTGAEAVDTIARIINSRDRNLALLVGRCLFTQSFIFDVNYAHIPLNDNTIELYKIDDPSVKLASETPISGDAESPSKVMSPTGGPIGVFTLLTECYSSTCSSTELCYSVSCPRRLEQLQNLKVVDAQLDRWSSSTQLLAEVAVASQPDKPSTNDDWWSNTVPIEVKDSVSKEEEKRQNAIYDIIKTEKNYVEELKMIQSLYAGPLRKTDIIEESRMESFMNRVFYNSAELLTVNSKLLQKLLQRQKENYIVEKIGDIFINIANELYVYVGYCGNREYSRNDIAWEKGNNPRFKEFLAKCIVKTDAKADSKHELDGYLHKPIARMASYLLLLKAIADKTPEGHPDKTLIPQAIKAIGDVLSKMNEASGITINKIKLMQLHQQINPEGFNLNLLAPDRRHHYEGKLIVKRSSGGSDVPCTVFLFDHMLVMTKERPDKRAAGSDAIDNNGASLKPKSYIYQIYKRPIPLELLILSGDSTKSPTAAPPTRNAPPEKSQAQPSKPSRGPSAAGESRLTFSITHLGRHRESYTFACDTEMGRNVWKDHLEKLKKVRQKRNKLETCMLVASGFSKTNKIQCSTVLNNRLVLGTVGGLYLGPEDSAVNPSDDAAKFNKVIDLENINQVDILKDHDMMLVLSDKTLLAFPLEILDPAHADNSSTGKKGRKIVDAINFFKLGVCADRTLVCAVRSTPLSSTVKVFEPVGLGGSKRRGKLGNLFRTSNYSMRLYREFYVPSEASSIHFLRTKLCVGCAKGFEIVDLETLDTQGLLDPSDASLNFILIRENVTPMAIFRVLEAEFLLCYNDFGIYVDKMGRRIKGDWIIHWAGTPTSFSFVAPYIIAYEPTFVEVWHVTTGDLQQVIPINGLVSLNATPGLMHCVMDSAVGDQQSVFKLNRIEDNE